MREHSHTHTHPTPLKDFRTPGLTLPGLNHTTHSVLRGQNKTHVNRLNAMTTKFQLHKYQGSGEKKPHVEISNSQGNREGTRQKGSQESNQSLFLTLKETGWSQTLDLPVKYHPPLGKLTQVMELQGDLITFAFPDKKRLDRGVSTDVMWLFLMFLLLGRNKEGYVCMRAKSLQWCPILCEPIDCSHQAPLSKGLSRQEYWRGFPCHPPGNLPNPGIKHALLKSPGLSDGFSTTSTTWKAHGGVHEC